MRASCTVHVNGDRVRRSRYRAQQACRTLRSNGALWAATNAASSIQARSVGHTSAKVGASCTSSQSRPWRSVNHTAQAAQPPIWSVSALGREPTLLRRARRASRPRQRPCFSRRSIASASTERSSLVPFQEVPSLRRLVQRPRIEKPNLLLLVLLRDLGGHPTRGLLHLHGRAFLVVPEPDPSEVLQQSSLLVGMRRRPYKANQRPRIASKQTITSTSATSPQPRHCHSREAPKPFSAM